MQRAVNGLISNEGGIQIRGAAVGEFQAAKQNFSKYLKDLGISQYVKTIDERTTSPGFLGFQLRDVSSKKWAPVGDTAQLCEKLNLDTYSNSSDLEREIVLAMLLCPVPFQFPSFSELMSAVRIRKNIVEAARKTSLSFATGEAERPKEFWTYDEDRGFILLPGKSLISALQHATQPEESGKRYTFSCWRATEYVILLALANEARMSNSELYQNLHRQAETRAIKATEFERVFLRRIGSCSNPLPPKFFVPGDRTWFRNPDKISSEITGYEGSFTFYLGAGLFADFWRPDRIYNLTSKCVTIYHWRNSTYRDSDGDLQIDEDRVDRLVESTLADPVATEQVMQEMAQIQEPMDIFGGGCIEAHRDHTCQICCGTSDLVLPDIHHAHATATQLN